MLVAGKRKYNHKSLREKCQALKDLEKGMSNKDVSAKYNVPKNTLSTWLRNKKKLMDSLETGANAKRQKLRTGSFDLVDKAVLNWFKIVRSKNVPLSAALIQEKAIAFAKQLNVENFQASDGWLRRWKERNHITFKTVSGESKSVTTDMVDGWWETSLPTLLSNYKLKDIYNADEFGLFYQCLPNKTYQLKSEKCSGGKLSKIRITGLAAANAVGEKLPMFVIGKAKNPRCFKNIKFLPCRYRNQQKSWMDSMLFEEWVMEIDRKFHAEGRKVALIIDNCPAHPEVQNLKATKLFFLPPNTTSQTQPMDQGVIRSLKASYRKRVVRKTIQSIEKNKSLPKISLLQGMQMLVSAWEAVTVTTVVNCFRKSKISVESQNAAIAEDDNPFKELEEEMDSLRAIQPDLDTDATSFTDVDGGVLIAQPDSLSDEDIIANVLGTDDSISDDEDDEPEAGDDPVECPDRRELLQMVDLMHRFSLFSKEGEIVQSYANHVGRILDKHFADSRKQTTIHDYFK